MEQEFMELFDNTMLIRSDKVNDAILYNVIVYNFKKDSGYVVKFDENKKPISPIKTELHPTLEMKKIYDKAYKTWKKEMTAKFFE